MLTQEFANKCTREYLEECYEDAKTLREFLSSYLGVCSADDEDIEDIISDDYVDLIDVWASDNDLDYTEMHEFIMNNLDHAVEYDVKIDTGYDEAPVRSMLYNKPYWHKEVRVKARALVDDISLEMDEISRYFEALPEGDKP